MENNNPNNGYHQYRVDFIYSGKSYSCVFFSTAEISTATDPLAAWGIADDAIKEEMRNIPNRKAGIYPHGIVLSGEFGSLTIKE